LIEGIGCCQIFVIGIKRGGVGLYKLVDLAADPLIESVKSAAINILAHELLQIGVILTVVCLILHQRIEEVCTRERIVDGVVDNTGGATAAAHAAKRQIIVPGDQIQLPSGFIEIVVVRHHAGQAVLVDGKHMDCHIAEQIINVHIGFEIIALRDIFERSNHPFVVGFFGAGHLTIPDGFIAVQFIIRVVEIRAASAHGEAAPAACKIEIHRRAFPGIG